MTLATLALDGGDVAFFGKPPRDRRDAPRLPVAAAGRLVRRIRRGLAEATSRPPTTPRLRNYPY